MWVFAEVRDQNFRLFLKQLLEQEHSVGIWDGERLELPNHPEVMLYFGRLPLFISAKRCIRLQTQKKKRDLIYGEVHLVCSDDPVSIPDGVFCYPCGYSVKACLTVSSKTEEQIVISLTRAIYSLYGRKIDPFDLPVKRIVGMTDEMLLYAYMIKLLLYPVKRG